MNASKLLVAAVAAFAVLILPRPSGAVDPEYRFTVVVLERVTLAEAETEAAALRGKLGDAFPVRVESHATWHSVRVGLFTGSHTALSALRRVQILGYEDAWVGAVPWPPPEAAQVEPGEPAGTRTDTTPPEEVKELEGPPPPPLAPPPPTEPARPVIAAPPAVPAPEPAPVPAPPPPAAAAAPRPDAGQRIQAQRIDGAAVSLDGTLDDTAWAGASFVTGFQQKGESRGYPSRAKTEVAFLYDDEALYVGARIRAADGAVIRAPRTRHDDPADADRIIVSLDTYRNRQTAYNFGVTAGGTRFDYYQPVDVFEVRDMSYDPIWQAKTAVNGSEWTAEMRVPFTSLEFRDGEEQVWGVNLQHISVGERQYEFWVVVPGSETGWSSRFGDLVGLSGVRSRARYSVTPYAAGRSVSNDTPGGSGIGEEVEWQLGGDAELDFRSGLSLAATINPDFGQVEADPAAVNLTDYEIFFPEKRPFFVEGAQLFQGSGPRYFYSRRIGAPPHADFADEFDDVGTTILGAAKLIGRLESGWSTGTMVALTDDEDVVRFDPVLGTSERFEVEPQTLYGVSRLQKDFGAGTTFGFIATGMYRDVPEGGSLENVLARESAAGGFDWNRRFAEGRYEFGGFLGGSWVGGDRDAILRLQGSSARYYQRPDADYVDVDPTATSLDGYTGGLRMGKIEGAWRWTLSTEARSPGFEINDVGAMATADDLGAFAQVAWGKPFSQGAFQRIDVAASVASGWNFGEVRQYTTPAVDAFLVWKNFWRTYFRLAHDAPVLSDSLTRGGPLMGTAEGWRGRIGFASNDAHRIVWSGDVTGLTDEFGSWGYTVGTQLLLRRGRHFTFSIGPGYERALDARQYYATMPEGRPETFGSRYVFAELDRSTLYARLRAGFAITPTLSLDLYAEPFAASGSFARFGELGVASGSDLRIYGEAEGTSIVRQEDGSYLVTDGASSFTLTNENFDLTSYRSNVVLRWEYWPGSTFFLVWSQNRVSEDILGDPVGPQELIDVFDAPTEDIFTAKVSFRLGPR